MSKPNERQVGGNHYGGADFQHWDWAVINFGPSYLASQATKYICRWQKKDGQKDLDKALHYTQKLREVHANGEPYPPVREAKRMDELILHYQLTPEEYRACIVLATYRTDEQLAWVEADIQDLRKSTVK